MTAIAIQGFGRIGRSALKASLRGGLWTPVAITDIRPPEDFAHLDAGAKHVLVSAPSRTLDDCDAVLLKGVNLDAFDPDAHRIVSMASCTTNALAPV